MLAAAVTVYGLLMSFIFSAGTRNRREGRAHPKMLVLAGFVLAGFTIAVAGLLPIWALFDPAAANALVDSL